MATVYPSVPASGPGRLRLLIPRCWGAGAVLGQRDLRSGGRATKLPAAPPAVEGTRQGCWWGK